MPDSGFNGDGTVEEGLKEIIPAQPIKHYLYRCDKRFHLDGLVLEQKEGNSYGLLSVVGEKLVVYEGCFHETEAGNKTLRVKKLANKVQRILTKHCHGGQSQNRLMRLQEESVDAVIKVAQELLVKTFIQDNVVKIKGLLIAGTGQKKLQIAQGLDKRLPFLGMLAMEEHESPESLFSKAESLIKKDEYDAEAKVLDEFLQDIRLGKGKAVYGVKETLEALKTGELKTLYICKDKDEREEKESEGKQEIKKLEELARAIGCEIYWFTQDSPTGSEVHKLSGHIAGLRWYAKHVDFSDE